MKITLSIKTAKLKSLLGSSKDANTVTKINQVTVYKNPCDNYKQ